MFVLSNEIKNRSPMRPKENSLLSNEKKSIKSDRFTMHERFSCKACFEQKYQAFYFWLAVPLTCGCVDIPEPTNNHTHTNYH